MANKKKIGEILVDQGVLSAKTVERTVHRSRKLNKKIGSFLEEIAIVTSDEIAEALSVQYGYKLVKNFAQYTYPLDLLNLVPKEVALEHHIFPLKKIDGKLAVAMADPTETKIISNMAVNLKMTIVPFIATRTEIMSAISLHYLGKEPIEDKENTILIVDDDKLIVHMLRNILTRYGYRCIAAMDGMEGYRVSVAERPSLIITDKEMPKLDGYGLISALKNAQETEGIPVILLTSVQDAHEEATAFEKGFFDFITKPVKEITLVTRVKRALQFGTALPVQVVAPKHQPRK